MEVMMPEVKNYNDIQKTLGWANAFFAGAWLVLLYTTTLTPHHRAAVQSILQTIKLDPLLRSLITLSVLSTVWGFVTVYLLRLHDRLYEPHLVGWRAAYDTDYILRGLCATYPARVPEKFFDLVFRDKSMRAKCMQRLFYKFVGDEKESHQELLDRFYAMIRNYWVIALLELYCIAFLVFGTRAHGECTSRRPSQCTWS